MVLHSLGGPDMLPQSYSFHMHNLPLCAGGMKGANGFVFPNLDNYEAAKLVWGVSARAQHQVHSLIHSLN